MRGNHQGAPALTPAQEERRMQGLRMLARIIARHCLAHPELYGRANGADGTGGVVKGSGAVPHDGGPKEGDV